MVESKQVPINQQSILKCIIIDDERENLDLMEYMLNHSGHMVQIINKIQDANTALEVLKNTQVDLVFLDIRMPGMSGFEILEKVGLWDFHVVFATAYDQFAIQALRLSAFDYLLKPINQEALDKVLNRLTQKIQEDDKKLNNLAFEKISNLTKSKSRKKLLPSTYDYINLDMNEVLYFEADSISSWAHLKNGKKLFINLQLKQLEDELIYIDFYRIHKSYLINLNEVVKVSKKDGITVTMADDAEIPLSRMKKSEFFERIQRL